MQGRMHAQELGIEFVLNLFDHNYNLCHNTSRINLQNQNTNVIFWQWAGRFVEQEEAFVRAVFLPNSVKFSTELARLHTAATTEFHLLLYSSAETHLSSDYKKDPF